MGTPMGLDPMLANAYKIYIAEVRRHLVEVKDVLETPETPDLVGASGRFHTIRGGAGFFGLSDIASVAGKLEYALLEPTLRFEEAKESIMNLVSELETLAQKMPKSE